MKGYNPATGRMLDPDPTEQPPQQRTSRLRTPQQGRSPVVAPMQGEGTDSNSLAVALANGGDPHESAGADATRDDTIDRLNKIIRAKNATIQEKVQEVERYKDLHDSFDHSLDISNDARETTQQIAHLVDDLAAEKRSHKAARESLEIALRAVEAQSVCLQEKDQEAEQHSMRLAELDQASAAVQDENLELLRRIQEMNNRLAEEQKAAAVAAESPEGEAGGGGLRKELKKLQQAVEMNACLLEAVKRQTILNSDNGQIHLADDLAAKKSSHEATRRILEEQSTCLQEKAREAEQHSMRLAELEYASAAVHDENLELSRWIQEMNSSLAQEQQAMKKRQQAYDMKMCQLEAVTERACKYSMELHHFKDQARRGRSKGLLLTLWWLLRTIGFLAFILFVHVAVSEDAFFVKCQSNIKTYLDSA